MHAKQHREREQYIAAETDKGLLTDRDQAGVAGEQVPARLASAMNVKISASRRSILPVAPARARHAKTTSATATSATPMRLDGVACSTRLIPTPSEEALRSHGQDGEKHDVTGQQLPAGINPARRSPARRRG